MRVSALASKIVMPPGSAETAASRNVHCSAAHATPQPLPPPPSLQPALSYLLFLHPLFRKTNKQTKHTIPAGLLLGGRSRLVLRLLPVVPPKSPLERGLGIDRREHWLRRGRRLREPLPARLHPGANGRGGGTIGQAARLRCGARVRGCHPRDGPSSSSSGLGVVGRGGGQPGRRCVLFDGERSWRFGRGGRGADVP